MCSSDLVNRSAAGAFEESMAFHVAPERGIGGHRPGLGLVLDQNSQIVGVQLVTPTGMLPMLLGDQFDELGRQGGVLPVIGADLAFERIDGPDRGAESFVVPAFDCRPPEEDPGAGDRVLPLLGGQFLELSLELAARGRCSEERSDDAEAKVRPALMRPGG